MLWGQSLYYAQKHKSTQHEPQGLNTISNSNMVAEKLQGWRSGILRGSILAFAVLMINLLLIVIATVKSRSPSNSQKIMYEGDCDKVKQMDIGLHLVINILSSLLLGASNYAMQCLSAPTRTEIDIAHKERIWLDIGVLSIRNLCRINPRRVILWTLFGLSSAPLHLL
jgi:hypothetical protein